MTDVAARSYGFYRTTTEPIKSIVLPSPVPVTRKVSPKKECTARQKKLRLAAGMYFDYCAGLEIDEIATKWATPQSNINTRFKQLGVPLRPRFKRTCDCMKRNRNPYDIGVRFEDSNRERARIAAEVMVERAKAALPTAPTEHARRILQLRIDHPTANLTELAALHEPPLTKHQVSAVLRRAKDAVR